METRILRCPVTEMQISESEVVDRLIQIFGEDNVEIISGLGDSSAAAKSRVPLDKALSSPSCPGNLERKSGYARGHKKAGA